LNEVDGATVFGEFNFFRFFHAHLFISPQNLGKKRARVKV
jgi:hypothetical protein